MKLLIRLLALLTLSMLLGACGGGSSGSTLGVLPSADSGSTITLERTSLAAGDEITVSAKVNSSFGIPAAGVAVTFSATPGLATVIPTQATTDISGMAYTRLRVASTATGVGQVTFSATVNGVLVQKTTNFYVNLPSLQLTDPYGYASTVTVGQTTTIYINVLDAAGQPYTSQPVDVTFTSTYGSLSSTKVSTGTTGTALVQYSKNSSISTYITDTLTANIGSSTKTFQITVNPLAASNISYTSASKTTLTYGESASVYYRVTDSRGGYLPNQAVKFYLVDMSGVAVPTTTATLQASSATSDSYGSVTAVMLTKTVPATVKVKATVLSDTIAALSAPLTITQAVPSGSVLTLSVPKLNIETYKANGDIDTGVTNAITATLVDNMGNPIANSPITFSTTGGTLSALTCTTDSTGKCSSVTWTNNVPVPSAGIAVITATTPKSDGTSLSTTTSIVMATSTATITNSCSSPTTVLDSSSITCNVKVTDSNGNIMPQGTTVKFTFVTTSGGGGTFSTTTGTYTFPNSNAAGGITLPVVISKDAAGGGAGTVKGNFTVTVNTPNQTAAGAGSTTNTISLTN
jgi:hypothetical protein